MSFVTFVFLGGAGYFYLFCFFFFSSRRRHTRLTCDWSSDVCSSDLAGAAILTLYDEVAAAVCNAGAAGAPWGRQWMAMQETSLHDRDVAPETESTRSEERRVGKEGRSRRSP